MIIKALQKKPAHNYTLSYYYACASAVRCMPVLILSLALVKPSYTPGLE